MATLKEVRAERSKVQYLLQGGLALSVVLMSLGLFLKCQSVSWNSPSVTMSQLGDGRINLGDRIAAAGILALAFTPVLRVVMLLILWGQQRDWKFAGVALVVLLTLVVAIFF